MRFDLLVPSGGNLDRICQLFASVVQQTILPERIAVVLDKSRDQDEIEHFLYSLHKTLGKVASRLVLVHHRNSDFEAEQGVGYVRKYLLSQATSSYVYMIDDDNVFDETFFERTSQIYQDIVGKIGTECVLSPTILLRKTGQIQSQGILGFASYLFPKYRFQQLTDQPWGVVQMIGGNSLFGPRAMFGKYTFDERFWGSYEDIDFTRGLTQQGVPIVVSRDLSICHMEQERGPLGTRQMATPVTAYARARNRIRCVQKHATSGQWMQYVRCGLWVQTLGFLVATKRRGGKDWWLFWRMIWKGTRDGLHKKYTTRRSIEKYLEGA